MNAASPDPAPDEEALPRIPGWIRTRRADALEDAAFASGAGLAHLHVTLAHTQVPGDLLRARLALRAAEVCVGHSGRPERSGDLRDAAHLTRPGDLPGPAGEVYLTWRRATARPLSSKSLHRALPDRDAHQIANWLDAGQGGPVARAASVLETVLAEDPRGETEALLLADTALSQALGWAHILPLLSCELRRTDLRKADTDLLVACHRALITSTATAAQLGAELARKTARLTAVAPKLRAKGAQAAVELFLTRDAVVPGRFDVA